MWQNLAARLWAASSLVTLDLVYGSHIVAAYSSCGRTSDLYIASGFDILWTRGHISLEKCCCLVGPFSHYVDVAVPCKFTVYSDVHVLGFRCLFQSMAMDGVCCLDYFPLVGDTDVLTFIWVEHHLPVIFPLL